MIKVLNIISDRNIGGAGRCVLNFLKHYDREKFDVSVALPRGSLLVPEINKLNTRTIEIDGIADKSLDFKAIGTLLDTVRTENPQIVHTHGTMSGRIAGRLAGKKVIYTRHSVFPVNPRIKKGLGRFLNKTVNELFADDIIAVADAAKENLTDGGISPDKIKVILNGVEGVKRLSAPEADEIRSRYDISSEDFVVGIMARLEAVKGHKYLIDAVGALKEKYGKSIKALIIGAGGIEDELKKYVNDKDMQDSVLFTGFIKNVGEILSVLDVQINASYGTEATSLALLEGMSMGIPAVVSDYGGNPGVIKDGENGLIFETKNSDALAEAILKLINDKTKYKYMQKRSVEIFKRKFTAEIYAANIQSVYEGVLK